MKQIESITFSPELVGEIKSANGELALVGRVPLNVVKTLTCFEYETLDLSRAVFEEEHGAAFVGVPPQKLPQTCKCRLQFINSQALLF